MPFTSRHFQTLQCKFFKTHDMFLKFWKFSVIISLSINFYPFTLGCLILSHISLRLCSFFFSFPLLCSLGWIISTDLFSNLPTLWTSKISFKALSVNFFHFSNYNFQLKTFPWFFFFLYSFHFSAKITYLFTHKIVFPLIL